MVNDLKLFPTTKLVTKFSIFPSQRCRHTSRVNIFVTFSQNFLNWVGSSNNPLPKLKQCFLGRTTLDPPAIPLSKSRLGTNAYPAFFPAPNGSHAKFTMRMLTHASDVYKGPQICMHANLIRNITSATDVLNCLHKRNLVRVSFSQRSHQSKQRLAHGAA